MSADRTPRRVRVVRSLPYRDAQVRAGASPQPGSDNGVTDVYDAALRRALLRWAVAALAVVCVPLLGLPLVMLLAPGLARASVAGAPLPWLLLGVLVHPLVWLAGRWYVAGAERTERDYLDALAERDPHHPGNPPGTGPDTVPGTGGGSPPGTAGGTGPGAGPGPR